MREEGPSLDEVNCDCSIKGEYSKLVGWEMESVRETSDGRLVEYSYVPIFRSSVLRARLVSEEGVEKVAYHDDPESIELFEGDAVRRLNRDLGIKLKR